MEGSGGARRLRSPEFSPAVRLSCRRSLAALRLRQRVRKSFAGMGGGASKHSTVARQVAERKDDSLTSDVRHGDKEAREGADAQQPAPAVDFSFLDFNEMSIAVQSLGTDFTEYATAIEEVDPEDVRDTNEYLDRIGVSNEEHRRALAVCAGELCENRKRSVRPSMRVVTVVDEKSQTSSLSIQPLLERASLYDGGPQSGSFLSSQWCEFPLIEGQSTLELDSIDYGSSIAGQVPARSDDEAAAKAQIGGIRTDVVAFR